MDNFKIIYKILKVLEEAMDYEEFDCELIGPDTLRISEQRWKNIMRMLSKEGYAEGIRVLETNSGTVVIKLDKPMITLKGLEYLNENSLMKKAASLVKGISEIIT